MAMMHKQMHGRAEQEQHEQQAIAGKYVRPMLVSQQEGDHAQEDEKHRSRA